MRFPILSMLLIAGQAVAAEPTFTSQQRHEIVQVIREAMKADPGILREAITALQADEQARAEADTRARLVDKHQALVANPADPVAGNPQGDVTLVEFYDPRCQYCRRMLPSIAALLQKDHGLRLIYKDIPVLGPASVMESRAILAAQRQGGYQTMQSALMADPAQPSAEMIAATARSLGLDPVKLAADMSSPAVSRQIEANLSLARDLKLDGTPVFVVGDTVIPGAVDEATLEGVIARARKHS